MFLSRIGIWLESWKFDVSSLAGLDVHLSGGDIGQLTYSHTNRLPNFQLLINHDDETREFAYSEKDNASLNAAKKGDWHVVSMKNDWKTIFLFNQKTK